jgi:hypothetical protein
MVTALPGNIRLKLEQTLAQWRQWKVNPPITHAPTVVSRLSAGLSNFSVLVEAGRQFVVRIDGIKPSAHGLNRQGEWRSLSAAHRADLAPHPCYFNPELGSLVCNYLAPDEQQPVDVNDIAKLLRDIHHANCRTGEMRTGSVRNSWHHFHRPTAAGAVPQRFTARKPALQWRQVVRPGLGIQRYG